MAEINLKNLDALISKAQELQKLLKETAEILGVNKSSISQFLKTGQLRGYIVAGSSRLIFWRSEVKALAKPAEKEYT